MAKRDVGEKTNFIGLKVSDEFKKAVEAEAFKSDEHKGVSGFIRDKVLDAVGVEDAEDLQGLVNDFERLRKEYPDKL